MAPAAMSAAAMAANCAQASILAQGIALNIADQQQELATANAMATLLQAQPVDAQAWAQARTNLLQFVNNGIAIRESNQLITPAQNRATAGVATVANAQLQELGLATNLTATGGDDVQGNLKIVQTLQMDFAGGIMQNQKNMADVSTRPFSLMMHGSVVRQKYSGADQHYRPWQDVVQPQLRQRQQLRQHRLQLLRLLLLLHRRADQTLLRREQEPKAQQQLLKTLPARPRSECKWIALRSRE